MRARSSMRSRGAARSTFRSFVGWCFVAFASFLVASSAAASVPVASEAPGSYELPADQPRGSARPLELPPAPSSFNVADRGGMHFAYSASMRARVQPLMRDADEI